MVCECLHFTTGLTQDVARSLLCEKSWFFERKRRRHLHWLTMFCKVINDNTNSGLLEKLAQPTSRKHLFLLQQLKTSDPMKRKKGMNWISINQQRDVVIQFLTDFIYVQPQ